MKRFTVMMGLLAIAQSSFAIDSYRYMHVSINTPWNIFIFLLMAIFSPFILMAVLSWYFSGKKTKNDNDSDEGSVDG